MFPLAVTLRGCSVILGGTDAAIFSTQKSDWPKLGADLLASASEDEKPPIKNWPSPVGIRTVA
jgi:hypothetical protein